METLSTRFGTSSSSSSSSRSARAACIAVVCLMLLGHFAAQSSLEAQVRRALFGAGQLGYMHRISPSHVFANADGTGTVAVGDPVAFIEDISGNGNHATQTISTARGVLRQNGARYYLETDGIDDYYRFTDVPVGATTGRVIALAGNETSSGGTHVIVSPTGGGNGYLGRASSVWYYRPSPTAIVSDQFTAFLSSVIASVRSGTSYLRVNDDEDVGIAPIAHNPFGALFQYDLSGGAGWAKCDYYGGALSIIEPTTGDIDLVKRWLDKLRGA